MLNTKYALSPDQLLHGQLTFAFTYHYKRTKDDLLLIILKVETVVSVKTMEVLKKKI
jgi:hypothetical protein